MQNHIVIMGLDGPAVNGTVWDIREGQQDLERVNTRREAERRARNKWAAPDQGIKVVNTNGKVEWLRQGSAGGTTVDDGGGGLFGGWSF